MFICTSRSVISGHLDGSLNLIGHHGHMMHGVSAHSKPISTLTYIGDYVITGSYDAMIKVSYLILIIIII